MSIAVIYHGHCADGFGAAYAAWKKFGDNAVYIGAQYGNERPVTYQYDEVYMLDFSYKREEIERMRAPGQRVVVIDHHKTAEAELEGLPDVVFDMHKSGAVLAWEYFHPNTDVPGLLRYVQDRDLWQWELANSREVSAGLWSQPMTFADWDWYAVNPLGLTRLASEGEAILRYMAQQVEMICNQAVTTTLGGYPDVPAVNATNLWSEVGEELLRRNPSAPFVACYYHMASGKVKWSLRSRGDFDVSEVARSYSGGGHKAAAGFEEAWHCGV